MSLRRGTGGRIRSHARSLSRSFGRTLAVGSVAGGLCIWQLCARAPAATADPPSWVPGSASAISQAIALAPSTAGLNYALTLATSVADYQATEGQAESETFTGGPVVTSATSVQCDGGPPAVSANKIPQPAIAESTAGNQSSTYTLSDQYANGAGVPQIGGGTEQALATTQPSAEAITKLTDFDVPGAFDVSGSQSRSFAQQVSGQLREATATADISELSLAGAAVVLRDMHWQDTQETGADGSILKQDASFSIGGLSIRGAEVPASVVSSSSAAQLLAIANTALTGTGIHVTAPSAGANADGTETISALSVGIDQSTLGQEVVGPLLGQTESVRDEIDHVLEDQVSCRTGVPITVVDILLGALSGGGNLDLELGGAKATSNGTAYADPFDNSLGLLGSGGAASSLPSGLGTGTALSQPAPYLLGSTTVSGAAPGARSAPAPQNLGRLAGAERCLTTSPAGRPTCSNGAALPVALAGLAVAAVTGACDFVRLRWFRRVMPDEVKT
jgi:hypothetical protein